LTYLKSKKSTAGKNLAVLCYANENFCSCTYII
jgi:hypothetical protein